MIKEFKNRILPTVAAIALLRLGALAADPSATTGGADSTGQVNLAGGEVIPVIQMEGAALTSTLESLGRQSGINFQFDPRITTPTVTADGRTNALATVTFRFENVTAAQAFFAVLDNYGLQFLSGAERAAVDHGQAVGHKPPQPELAEDVPWRLAGGRRRLCDSGDDWRRTREKGIADPGCGRFKDRKPLADHARKGGCRFVRLHRRDGGRRRRNRSRSGGVRDGSGERKTKD